MIAAATRQDLQSALERTKSSIIGTMFSRNDAKTVATQLRASISQDFHELHVQHQQLSHQSQAQYEQITQRLSRLEQRIYSLQQALSKFTETQSRYANNIYYK